jgi:hypothetical protein
MPFTTFYGPNTTISEKCLWVADGTRRICISYEYNTTTGILHYAASVFRCEWTTESNGAISIILPSDEEMMGNAHTTERRFEIRPVIIQVATNLGYDEIITTIRSEMCHGYGCKGPRNIGQAFNIEVPSEDDDGTSSTNSFLSDGLTEYDNEEEHNIDWYKLERKRIHHLRYISDSNTGRFHSSQTPITREFFIAFKANKNTGDLLYGATISRRSTDVSEMIPLSDELIDAHYDTAVARLEKYPVYINIPEEFRHQLNKNAEHREDIMYLIIDRIKTRRNGRLLLREF